MRCLSGAPSTLVELTLEPNPLCEDPSYKFLVLESVRSLKLFDAKRVTVGQHVDLFIYLLTNSRMTNIAWRRLCSRKRKRKREKRNAWTLSRSFIRKRINVSDLQRWYLYIRKDDE